MPPWSGHPGFLSKRHMMKRRIPSMANPKIGKKHGYVCNRTWGAEYFGVAAFGKDIEVNKHRYSAFFKNGVELSLRALVLKLYL